MALDVRCPQCGARVGMRCRTLTTNRSTDTHADRMNLAQHAAETQAMIDRARSLNAASRADGR